MSNETDVVDAQIEAYRARGMVAVAVYRVVNGKIVRMMLLS